MKETIAVWFSCGAASAVAAKLTIDKYGKTHNVIVLNNPIKEEDDDNRRFLSDVEKWIGHKIEPVINSKYPDCSAVVVWEERKYMSGIHGAPCTVVLKKEARYEYEKTHPIHFHVLGYTVEEKHRHDNFVLSENPNLLPVLIDAGLSKQDCADIVQAAGIEVPDSYKDGYPNANCKGCVKATSPTYWNHVRKVDPDVFIQRAEQSRRLGVRLVRHKGKRIFLDELPEDAVGAPMKSIKFECGIFCEPETIVK